jgi:flagellar hook-associated protein 1 FlgK
MGDEARCAGCRVGLLNSIAIGRRAIGAAAAGIDVTSQNVANANTVGYTRRRVLTETVDPIQRRGVFVGQGVSVTGITRASDRILSGRLVGTAGQHGHSAAAEETLRTTEALFDESAGTGLAEVYGRFFDSLSGLTSDPGDIVRRGTVRDAARQVATVVNRTAQGLAQAIEGVDTRLADTVSEINTALREIASLNRAIGRSGAALGPGDLLDRRDQLVYALGETIGATVDLQEDGQATVFIGEHAAVTAGEARTITITEDAAGDAQVFLSAGGGTVRLTESVAGSVGGRLAARSQMQGWASDLDNFVVTFADAMNAQNAAGFDTTGAPGGDLFTYAVGSPATSLSVASAYDANPRLLAAAGAATAAAGDTTNLQALIDLENLATYGATGTSDGGTEIARIVADVGAAVNTAATDAEAYGAQLSDLEAMREAVAGVDTDEEAIRLVEYQAAYRAAARVLQVGDELMQTLMAIGA